MPQKREGSCKHLKSPGGKLASGQDSRPRGSFYFHLYSGSSDFPPSPKKEIPAKINRKTRMLETQNKEQASGAMEISFINSILQMFFAKSWNGKS